MPLPLSGVKRRFGPLVLILRQYWGLNAGGEEVPASRRLRAAWSAQYLGRGQSVSLGAIMVEGDNPGTQKLTPAR